MSDRLTDEQLRDLLYSTPNPTEARAAIHELLALRARVAREAQLVAALREAKRRVECFRDGVFTDKGANNAIAAIDAALSGSAQPAESGATLVQQIADKGQPYPWEPKEGDIRAGRPREQSAATNDEIALDLARPRTAFGMQTWPSDIKAALDQARAEAQAAEQERILMRLPALMGLHGTDFTKIDAAIRSQP